MKLIVNADDFGVDLDRDLGITYGVLRGYISSVSVIVTNGITPFSNFLLQLIKKRASVGLHVNLTDAPLKKYSPEELCTGSYQFEKQKYVFWMNCIDGTIDIRRIKEEICLQTWEFERLLGFRPQHLDGHNHCNIFSGELNALFEEIAQKGGIHLRIPYEQTDYFDFRYLEGSSLAEALSGRNDVKFPSIHDAPDYYFENDVLLYNIMCQKNCGNDLFFIGSLYGHVRTTEALCTQIKRCISVPQVQLMVHPGFYFCLFPHKTPFSCLERFIELMNLKKLHLTAKAEKIPYINYSDLVEDKKK